MPVTFAGIHYDDTEGGTEAVVLLHGVTLDRRMWEAQVEHLAHTHRCLAVDRRGHGLSAPLREGWDPMVDLAGNDSGFGLAVPFKYDVNKPSTTILVPNQPAYPLSWSGTPLSGTVLDYVNNPSQLDSILARADGVQADAYKA